MPRFVCLMIGVNASDVCRHPADTVHIDVLIASLDVALPPCPSSAWSAPPSLCSAVLADGLTLGA